jgi:hypothetical protein
MPPVLASFAPITVWVSVTVLVDVESETTGVTVASTTSSALEELIDVDGVKAELEDDKIVASAAATRLVVLDNEVDSVPEYDADIDPSADSEVAPAAASPLTVDITVDEVDASVSEAKLLEIGVCAATRLPELDMVDDGDDEDVGSVDEVTSASAATRLVVTDAVAVILVDPEVVEAAALASMTLVEVTENDAEVANDEVGLEDTSFAPTIGTSGLNTITTDFPSPAPRFWATAPNVGVIMWEDTEVEVAGVVEELEGELAAAAATIIGGRLEFLEYVDWYAATLATSGAVSSSSAFASTESSPGLGQLYSFPSSYVGKSFSDWVGVAEDGVLGNVLEAEGWSPASLALIAGRLASGRKIGRIICVWLFHKKR